MLDSLAIVPYYAHEEVPMFARLVEERRKRGWTKAELARRAGISESLVHRIEQGERAPTVWSFERLARALDLPPWFLMQQYEEERGKGDHDATTNDATNRG